MGTLKNRPECWYCGAKLRRPDAFECPRCEAARAALEASEKPQRTPDTD